MKYAKRRRNACRARGRCRREVLERQALQPEHARLGADAESHSDATPCILYAELLVKYTGGCQNGFNVQGYARRAEAVHAEVLPGPKSAEAGREALCSPIQKPHANLVP